MKADAFRGKVAIKMAALEEFLKENKDGKGFFVGDSVSICKLSWERRAIARARLGTRLQLLWCAKYLTPS